MLYHSTYFWFTHEPTPPDQEGLYSRSLFQEGDRYYKITMGIPDQLRERLQIFTPHSLQPIGLTDQTFDGQYSGISVPEDLYEELLTYTIIYGRAITGGVLELVFDGREIN